MNTEIIKSIESIIEEAARMKNAYFWTPDGCAGGRRYFEKKHSHDMVEWDEDGHHYSAEYTVSCSCKYVYANGHYTKDGVKTTLTAIKNSLKRMVAVAE